MIRGTTPTLKFTLPFPANQLSEAWVTISQVGQEILTKKLCDCEAHDNIITITLSQEDTLKLACNCTSQIQMRVRTNEGEAMASQIFSVNIGEILKDGVI